MIRNVLISTTEWPVQSGLSFFVVRDETAAKMLEVYDKAQKFEPIEIEALTTVSVEKPKRNLPIVVKMDNRVRLYSIEEAKRFSEALLAAVDYVEKHR